MKESCNRSAFDTPKARSGNILVRVQPPQIHRSLQACGGLRELYSNITHNHLPAIHVFGTYTDDQGVFLPQLGMPLLASRYVFLEVIGQGQSSVLIKAKDTFHRDELVSIKVLHTQYHMLGAQEMHCLRILNRADPHCISPTLRLKNIFSFDEHYCMVFELLNPMCLVKMFVNLTAAEKMNQLRRVTLHLLQGLGFLQQQNVIHADLKPDNILLKTENEVESLKIVDFGNAIHCVHDELSLYYDDFELQTLLYRAPEVMFGVPFGIEVDMWSLGCVLAEFFLGKPLFYGKDKPSIIYKMTQVLGPLPQDCFQRGKFYKDLMTFTRVCQQEDATANLLKAIGCDYKYYVFADFLAGLLKYNPGQRLSVKEAAQHPFLAPIMGLGYLFQNKDQNSGYSPVHLKKSAYNHAPEVCPQNVKHMSSIDLLHHGTAAPQSDLHVSSSPPTLLVRSIPVIVVKPNKFSDSIASTSALQEKKTKIVHPLNHLTHTIENGVHESGLSQHNTSQNTQAQPSLLSHLDCPHEKRPADEIVKQEHDHLREFSKDENSNHREHGGDECQFEIKQEMEDFSSISNEKSCLVAKNDVSVEISKDKDQTFIKDLHESSNIHTVSNFHDHKRSRHPSSGSGDSNASGPSDLPLGYLESSFEGHKIRRKMFKRSISHSSDMCILENNQLHQSHKHNDKNQVICHPSSMEVNTEKILSMENEEKCFLPEPDDSEAHAVNVMNVKHRTQQQSKTPASKHNKELTQEELVPKTEMSRKKSTIVSKSMFNAPLPNSAPYRILISSDFDRDQDESSGSDYSNHDLLLSKVANLTPPTKSKPKCKVVKPKKLKKIRQSLCKTDLPVGKSGTKELFSTSPPVRSDHKHKQTRKSNQLRKSCKSKSKLHSAVSGSDCVSYSSDSLENDHSMYSGSECSNDILYARVYDQSPEECVYQYSKRLKLSAKAKNIKCVKSRPVEITERQQVEECSTSPPRFSPPNQKKGSSKRKNRKKLHLHNPMTKTNNLSQAKSRVKKNSTELPRPSKDTSSRNSSSFIMDREMEQPISIPTDLIKSGSDEDSGTYSRYHDPNQTYTLNDSPPSSSRDDQNTASDCEVDFVC